MSKLKRNLPEKAHEIVPTVDPSEMVMFSLNQELEKLRIELLEKTAQIIMLKEALKEKNTIKLSVSDEEFIADEQIRLLKQQAAIRPLTLEETRQYDLFVKNKRLIQGDATNIVNSKPLPSDKQNLMKIAKTNVK